MARSDGTHRSLFLRPLVRRLAVVLLGSSLPLLAAAPAAAQQGMEDVEITTVPVAGSVHMLQGRGGNIGVSAGEDGLLIVDDQFAPLADRIRAALSELSDGELEFVLNTHFHGDHTGGNEVFGRIAHIIAHDNVRRRLADPAPDDDREPLGEVGLPVITFDRSLSLHFNGEEIEVMHLPHGHTDGDAVIYFTESNVVHMGDDFFAGAFPFVDLDHGGDVRGLVRNVAHVLDRVPEDARVIPGHGELSTTDDLREYHRMLRETVGIVRDRRERGMSLEESRDRGLPEEWASWGEGFISTDRWIETIHRSLEMPVEEREAHGGTAASDAGPGAEHGHWHPHGHEYADEHADHEHGAGGGGPDPTRP